jgi:hypothetical protein
MLKNVLFFSCLFHVFGLFAQDYDIDYEVKTKYGFLIAHRPIMSHMPKEFTKCLEFNLLFQTKGTKSWHQEMNQPKFGFSFVATSAGNKELLGNLYGSYAFLQFPVLGKKHNFLYGKIGTGLGFASKVFDQQNNPKNIALSSHVNALINFGLFYQHNFKKSHLNLGLDLTHLSNGASKMPNLGVNLPYFTLAYGRNFRETTKSEFKEASKLKSDWSYLFVGIGGFKETYPTGGKKYPVIAGSFFAQKLFSHKVGYETGLDFIYKPSINTYKPIIYKANESFLQMAIYNGYLMTLDKLQIVVGLGIYLKDEFLADDFFYNRVGFRYYFKENFFANLTLKSHWAKADYVEYGIGIRL